MRHIDKISVHCMASSHKHHDNVETLYQWHVIENGWRMIGYQVFIASNGDIYDESNHELMRKYSMTPAAVRNHNTGMIAICLWGGKEEDFTEAQFKSLRRIVEKLRYMYNVNRDAVRGHNEYEGHETRGCPLFNVQDVLYGVKGVKQWQ